MVNPGYSKGDLSRFLIQFQVEKGSEFTHTSIWAPKASYYVLSENLPRFYELYSNAFLAGEDLYLTEKHRDISPILIDFDFRYQIPPGLHPQLEMGDGDFHLESLRKHDSNLVDEIVKIYSLEIDKWVDVPDNYDIYLLEKPSPRLDSNVMKDGLHIVIPGIVTKPSVQILIRDRILEKMKNLLQPLQLSNPIEDVIDEAVIYRNNWQMYGSRKPESAKYEVTRIMKWSTNNKNLSEILPKSDRNYTIDLSIRNKWTATEVREEVHDEVEKMEYDIKARERDKRLSRIVQPNRNNKHNVTTNLEIVEKLVDILDVNKADDFQSWIRVGWCLRNIDWRLLDKWDLWSKNSDKYQEGKCHQLWNYMKSEGLGLGTLHMWAREDNPQEYAKIIQDDMRNILYTSKSGTHFDIANVVWKQFQQQYVCVGVKQNGWFEFRDHRWVVCDNGWSLNRSISEASSKLYIREAQHYSTLASQTEDAMDQDRYNDLAKNFSKISTKLKTTSFKNNILSECKNLFYHQRFEEKLDTRCHLIGFENGVYDLELQEFREGRPEDWITFSTGIDYVEYDPTNPIYDEIDEFLSKVYTKPHVKEYVLLLLASFLNGNVREERFHIWTGSGSNGKTKLLELFERAFGEYCIKFPITLLTQKRASSNSANAEVVRSKGKRFACLQEPNNDEKLNCGLMKELSGGDKIQARGLYKDPIEFKPQFKMILVCNHLPTIPSDDGGTWRRIRANEHTSKFVEKPDPKDPNQFYIDTDLSGKFDDWKECFMSLLIEYYKKYIEVGIEEPPEITEKTRLYQKSNDNYLEFIESEMEQDPEAFISDSDLIETFRKWVREVDPQGAVGVKKRDHNASFSKQLGKLIKNGRGTSGWKGWCLKPQDGDNNPNMENHGDDELE